MNDVLRSVAVLVMASAATVVGQSPGSVRLYPGDAPTPQPACATESRSELNGRVRLQALPGGLADGEPFTFDQDPPVLFADYTGSVTLQNFSVVGDFPTAQFIRVTREGADHTETWSRTTTRAVGGQLISVFNPTWSNSEVDATLSARRFGFDRPFVYWGAFQLPDGATQRFVYLRTGLGGIPSSPVVRINDAVQYASDVVNLVVPTFDDAE